MKVAARRVRAQRPARAAGLLPGRERERVFEQARKRAQRERGGRHRARSEKILVRGRDRLLVGPEDRRARERGAGVAPEGIGLVRPVEPPGPRGEAVEVMLGALVVAHHDFELGGAGHRQTLYPSWMAKPLNELCAAEAARRIEAGEVTAEALAAACLERIDTRDEQV